MQNIYTQASYISYPLEQFDVTRKLEFCTAQEPNTHTHRVIWLSCLLMSLPHTHDVASHGRQHLCSFLCMDSVGLYPSKSATTISWFVISTVEGAKGEEYVGQISYQAGHDLPR
jgi:hypothetical protein